MLDTSVLFSLAGEWPVVLHLVNHPVILNGELPRDTAGCNHHSACFTPLCCLRGMSFSFCIGRNKGRVFCAARVVCQQTDRVCGSRIRLKKSRQFSSLPFGVQYIKIKRKSELFRQFAYTDCYRN